MEHCRTWLSIGVPDPKRSAFLRLVRNRESLVLSFRTPQVSCSPCGK